MRVCERAHVESVGEQIKVGRRPSKCEIKLETVTVPDDFRAIKQPKWIAIHLSGDTRRILWFRPKSFHPAQIAAIRSRHPNLGQDDCPYLNTF
jgi:hypothetical protein